MWTKRSEDQPQPQNQSEMRPAPLVSATPKQASEVSYSAPSRPNMPNARGLACVGASLEIKGDISGEEDLHIDGKVEGRVSLRGHRLTVGRNAQVNSEITAREVMIHGRVTGHVRGIDRVEIKKDALVTGDTTTPRLSIDDGAIVKGRIDVEGQERKAETKLQVPPRAKLESEERFVPVEVN